MKESLKKVFIDEKGIENLMIIETSQSNSSNPTKKQPKFNDKQKKSKGIFTSDIGIHSSGFAGIMGLAMIISLAGIIIAYLFLKF